MKIKDKIVLLSSSVVLSISMLSINTEALVDNEFPQSPKDFGNYSVKDAITVNGIQENLYTTYDNSQEALNKCKDSLRDFLNLIAKNYTLDELNDINYKDYLYAGNDYISRNDVSSEVKEQFWIYWSFVDIFENSEINSNIYKYAKENLQSSNNQIIILQLDDIAEEFTLMLPESENVSQQYNKTQLSQIAASTVPNAQNGRDYAINWANTPNTNQYYYFSNGDCANFASQILEASGVQQEVYDSVYSGWWHKKNWLGIHTHSQSWSLAATFARYQGMYQRSTDLYSFTSMAQLDDVVGFDRSNDGDIDHIGYVTSIGTWDRYNGVYYRDIKIAQHTSNYNLWISNANNGWDDAQDGTLKYYILRRNGLSS